MKRIEAIGEIQGGTLRIRNRKNFEQELKKERDGTFLVSVERFGSRRSLMQNAYLWGVVYKHIGEHCGYSTDEVHEICKQKFLSRNYFLPNKDGEFEEVIAPGSSKRLTKLAFMEYIDKCVLLAGELGISIPQPNEYEDNDHV